MNIVNEFSTRWLTLFADSFIKSLILLGIAAAFILLLRRHSAALRHFLWCIAILSLPLIPLSSGMLPPIPLPVLPHQYVVQTSLSPMSGVASPAMQVGSEQHPIGDPSRSSQASDATKEPVIPKANAMKPSPVSVHWSTWVMLVWAAGVIVFLLPLLLGLTGVWRQTRQCTQNTSAHVAGLAHELAQAFRHCRPVRFLNHPTDARTTVPMSWGVLRPVILLPSQSEEWSLSCIRSVLAHELAHVHRCDWLTQMLAWVVCAMYWFNPLLWFATRRLRIEREQACDDRVLTTGITETDYADHLLAVVKASRVSRLTEMAAVSMARTRRLETRLRAILDGNRDRRAVTRRLALATLLLTGLILLPLGVLRLAQADEDSAQIEAIQDKLHHTLQPPPNATEEQMRQLVQEFMQLQLQGVQLCDQFLETRPNSPRREEVTFYRPNFEWRLGKFDKALEGVETFLDEHPQSEYTPQAHLLHAYLLEKQQRYEDATAALDRIEDGRYQYQKYAGLSRLYNNMMDHQKAAEYRALAHQVFLQKEASDFQTRDLKGNAFSLGSLRGKVVLLCLFHTWSSDQTRLLQSLAEKYESEPDFAIVSICLDRDLDMVRGYVAQHTMPWIHVEATDTIAARYGFLGYGLGTAQIPQYFVIHKQGLAQACFGILDIIKAGTQFSDVLGNMIDALVRGTESVQTRPLQADTHPRPSADSTKAPSVPAADSANEDVIEALKEIVAIREEQFQVTRIKLEQNLVSQMEVGEAQKAVSEARIRLATAQHQPALVVEELRKIVAHLELQAKVLQAKVSAGAAIPAEVNDARIQVLEARIRLAEAIRQNTGRQELEKRLPELRRSFVLVTSGEERFIGAVLTDEGHILLPLIEGGKPLTVRSAGHDLPAELVASDKDFGVTVVQVKGLADTRPISLASPSGLKPEDRLVLTSIHATRDSGQIIIDFRAALKPDGKVPQEGTGDFLVSKINSMIEAGDFVMKSNGELVGLCLSDKIHYEGRNPMLSILPMPRLIMWLYALGDLKLTLVD